MLELPRHLLYQAWVSYWNIGYKKRIALHVVIALVIISFALKSFFIANLAELSFNSGASNALWDRWAHNAGYKYFKSIGDVYDTCDTNRQKKAGKVFIYLDEKTQKVKAVVVANFTMRANVNSGTAHVVAKYHGRPVYDRKHDICKVEDVDTFSCPMKQGQEMHIFETFSLPKYIPKGRYYSQAMVYNEDGECVAAAVSDFKV